MSHDPEPSSADSARAEALVGSTVAERYKLVELIAIGGMGAVYRGEHVHMRKRVAVKVLHPEMAGFPELVERFEREAIAGAHIEHQNVASATDFGRFGGGSYYLTLEYVRGITLHQLIREGPVPAARAAHIASQVAAGLGAGHKMGVVHRDIKPRNIMLVDGQSDLIKIIDYGFAKVPLDRLSTTDSGDGDMSITQRGVAFGTIAYMPPEIAQGMEFIDERSDLYSLGIVLYEMLTGMHPFDGGAPGEIFLQQRTEAPPPLKLRNPKCDVPSELEAVVMRLLRKDPGERYATADDLVRALDAAVPKAEEASLGLIPWSSTLPMSVAGGPSSMRTHATRPSVDMPPAPPLPHVPYEPKLQQKPKGRSPASVIILALLGLTFSVLLVFYLRDYKDSAEETPEADDSAAGGGATSETTTDTADDTLIDVDLSEDSPDPGAMRTRLGNAFANKQWKEGADALLALAKAEPAAFDEENIQIAAAAVAVRIDAEEPVRGTEVFEVLAHRLGSSGLDVLYRVVAGYGRSDGARRALAFLQREDVIEKATPALKIAMELRTARCEDKPELFERASAEGDDRALALLDGFRSSRCKAKQGECCFHKHGDLEKAVQAITERLRASGKNVPQKPDESIYDD